MLSKPLVHETESLAPRTTGERMARVFVGVKLAPETAGELVRIAQELAGPDVRRVIADDIHLTLVPPWSEPALREAIAKLDQVAGQFTAFSLMIRRAAYGPNQRRPRLLWAECIVTDELAALRAALLDAFAQIDERPFRPHVTLARIRGDGFRLARKHPIDLQLSLTQQVCSIQLFQSPRPDEQGYRVLASAGLRSNSI